MPSSARPQGLGLSILSKPHIPCCSLLSQSGCRSWWEAIKTHLDVENNPGDKQCGEAASPEQLCCTPVLPWAGFSTSRACSWKEKQPGFSPGCSSTSSTLPAAPWFHSPPDLLILELCVHSWSCGSCPSPGLLLRFGAGILEGTALHEKWGHQQPRLDGTPSPACAFCLPTPF